MVIGDLIDQHKTTGSKSPFNYIAFLTGLLGELKVTHVLVVSGYFDTTMYVIKVLEGLIDKKYKIPWFVRVKDNEIWIRASHGYIKNNYKMQEKTIRSMWKKLSEKGYIQETFIKDIDKNPTRYVRINLNKVIETLFRSSSVTEWEGGKSTIPPWEKYQTIQLPTINTYSLEDSTKVLPSYDDESSVASLPPSGSSMEEKKEQTNTPLSSHFAESAKHGKAKLQRLTSEEMAFLPLVEEWNRLVGELKSTFPYLEVKPFTHTIKEDSVIQSKTVKEACQYMSELCSGSFFNEFRRNMHKDGFVDLPKGGVTAEWLKDRMKWYLHGFAPGFLPVKKTYLKRSLNSALLFFPSNGGGTCYSAFLEEENGKEIPVSEQALDKLISCTLESLLSETHTRFLRYILGEDRITQRQSIEAREALAELAEFYNQQWFRKWYLYNLECHWGDVMGSFDSFMNFYLDWFNDQGYSHTADADMRINAMGVGKGEHGNGHMVWKKFLDYYEEETEMRDHYSDVFNYLRHTSSDKEHGILDEEEYEMYKDGEIYVPTEFHGLIKET